MTNYGSCSHLASDLGFFVCKCLCERHKAGHILRVFGLLRSRLKAGRHPERNGTAHTAGHDGGPDGSALVVDGLVVRMCCCFAGNARPEARLIRGVPHL